MRAFLFCAPEIFSLWTDSVGEYWHLFHPPDLHAPACPYIRAGAMTSGYDGLQRHPAPNTRSTALLHVLYLPVVLCFEPLLGFKEIPTILNLTEQPCVYKNRPC